MQNRTAFALRSVEDLADAKDLRAMIAQQLCDTPINEPALRAAVWNFVGNERRADVPAAEVISRLTALIDEAGIGPRPAYQALQRRVILWCVEEYFGHLGGNPFREGISRAEAVSPS
jgi:hypothetical protein